MYYLERLVILNTFWTGFVRYLHLYFVFVPYLFYTGIQKNPDSSVELLADFLSNKLVTVLQKKVRKTFY